MLTRIRPLHIVLTVVWVVAAAWSLWGGLEYYQLGLHDRAYSELHDLYKPAGLIGHGLGILGSLMMIVGVAMYSIRKRVRAMESKGALRTWLTVHIFLCTLGPWFVLLHTAFRFGGIISIAFWSMAAVVFSGIFGRYVYVRIPKAANGQFLSPQALTARKNHLLQSILERYDVDEAWITRTLAVQPEPVATAGFSFSNVPVVGLLQRKRAFENLGREKGMSKDAASMFGQHLLDYDNLLRQARHSGLLQRLFGYWHVFHLPLAVIMLIIMVFHIVVAFMFGYFWIA